MISNEGVLRGSECYDFGFLRNVVDGADGWLWWGGRHKPVFLRG